MDTKNEKEDENREHEFAKDEESDPPYEPPDEEYLRYLINNAFFVSMIIYEVHIFGRI